MLDRRIDSLTFRIDASSAAAPNAASPQDITSAVNELVLCRELLMRGVDIDAAAVLRPAEGLLSTPAPCRTGSEPAGSAGIVSTATGSEAARTCRSHLDAPERLAAPHRRRRRHGR
jgi:hypothetical protein